MSDCHSNDVIGNASAKQSNEADLEKQRVGQPSASEASTSDGRSPLTIVVSNGELNSITEVPGIPKDEFLSCASSPQKELFSMTSTSDDQCRICQQEKEELLIELGCLCRGGLAKAHRSCIDTWFRSKGSNKCEICQVVAANVSPPQSHHGTSYWIWRIDPTYTTQDPQRHYCCSPLWLAFAILIGGLLLDILVSITLGISALPVNIVIGVIVVLGLGTVFRLALEFFQEWNSTRGTQRVESNVSIGYFPEMSFYLYKIRWRCGVGTFPNESLLASVARRNTRTRTTCRSLQRHLHSFQHHCATNWSHDTVAKSSFDFKRRGWQRGVDIIGKCR